MMHLSNCLQDYEFRQTQSNNSLQQLGTFAVHQNKIGFQVYPQYQLNVTNEAVPYHLQGCGGQLLEAGLNKQESDSSQMNLCRISRFLSDESFQKHSVIQPVLPAKILSTTDNSISSDSEDYPPPPGYFLTTFYSDITYKKRFLCAFSLHT
ncbi:Uncharacterized protein BM_BM13073 [Brugia malayi]|uniref:Uncharacterized protein n=1 Tax=Brugia malayi TaxID=6279 RepID=A0A4E9EVZ9_BRUMA|nr:Uncharacterized protein BM_BM13073 [Brugia malayi]VIO86907.1 Uncharacterized protein BM_BM13073 [Brugia malayi]